MNDESKTNVHSSDLDSNGVLSKDFNILKDIAASLIHENADLKNEIEEKEHELNLLYKVMQEISYSMDWNEIQISILDLIIEFFPVLDLAMIAIYEEDTDRIKIKTRRRKDPHPINEVMRLGVNINDTTTWDEIVSSTAWGNHFNNLTKELNLQTSFIPLKLKSRELGFLMVGKPADSKYGKGEWRFLRTISNHLAVTLENAELYRLATTDTLTGLFNRRYFMDRLSREIDRTYMRGDRLSLLMIDIDHFKQVNDTHGHPAGDAVLRDMADRLHGFVKHDGIVSRYGGEEFTVILPHFDTPEAFDTAEKLRISIVDKPFSVQTNGTDFQIDLTISIGVSTCPTDTSEIESLIAKSDQALYLAKAQGRNQVVSNQRLNTGE